MSEFILGSTGEQNWACGFGDRFQVTTGPSSLMDSTAPVWLDLLQSGFQQVSLRDGGDAGRGGGGGGREGQCACLVWLPQRGVPLASSVRSGIGLKWYWLQSYKETSEIRHHLGIISTSEGRSYFDRDSFYSFAPAMMTFLMISCFFGSAAFFPDFCLWLPREVDIELGKLWLSPLEQLSNLTFQFAAFVQVSVTETGLFLLQYFLFSKLTASLCP